MNRTLTNLQRILHELDAPTCTDGHRKSSQHAIYLAQVRGINLHHRFQWQQGRP